MEIYFVTLTHENTRQEILKFTHANQLMMLKNIQLNPT